MKMTSENLQVLIGDDQIGVEGSPSRLNFEENYGELLVFFSYETDPDEVVRRARGEKWNAVVTDYDYQREDTNGLEVLDQIKGIDATLILHTGTEEAQAKEILDEQGITRQLIANSEAAL
jgi:CheY-like chemotaxis protein|tara:strand:+ start:211 stop:570 length:360 start_codon:yes stop_codon:yes gene_type:complete